MAGDHLGLEQDRPVLAVGGDVAEAGHPLGWLGYLDAGVVEARRGQDRRVLQEKVVELEEKLTSRKLIDRAKGILMKTGLSEEEAYHEIQMRARARRTTMSRISQDLIEKKP